METENSNLPEKNNSTRLKNIFATAALVGGLTFSACTQESQLPETPKVEQTEELLEENEEEENNEDEDTLPQILMSENILNTEPNREFEGPAIVELNGSLIKIPHGEVYETVGGENLLIYDREKTNTKGLREEFKYSNKAFQEDLE